ncbi:MAG TPA: carboxypeptidase-like regulatory domain-containing protein, partial [Planctomycetota bacterium]
SGSTPASDREGRFRVTRVGLEVTRVRTQGDLLRQGEVALDPSRGDALDLVLRVTRGGTITGDVTWPDGTQPVSFSVQVEGPGYQDRSGHTGRFQVRGVPPGRYQVRVRAAREGILGRARVDDVEPDGAPLRLVLVEEASCTLSGVVLDGSEEPVESLHVSADQVGGDQRRESAQGSGGRFQLKNLTAGVWIVRVSARGFLDAERRVELSAGSTQELHIVLTGAGRIRGRVVDASGRAVAGAWVGDEGSAYTAYFRSGEGGTDAEGRFELEPGKPRIRLLALSDEHGPSEPLELEVPAGHTLENVELRLTPACRLAGRVLDEDGRPLAGARVAVATRSHLQDTAETDPRGHFELLRLPPGEHTIVATHESRPWALASASATVISDSSGLELRFQKEEPVVLEGRVTRGARPWSGPVRLFSRHGQAELEVGADGLFRTTLRWPGEWRGAILLDGVLGEEGADLRRWELVVPEAERHVVALELESLPPLGQPWDLWR